MPCMPCLNRAQIEERIIDVHAMEELAEHLEDCAVCRKLYDDCLEERTIWRAALVAETLPDHFTDQVMSALEHVEIEPSPNKQAVSAKQSHHGRHRLSAPVLVRAAILLLFVTGSLAVFVQPSVAEFVRSMFSSSEWPDSGILQAKEWGLVQHPGIRVEDQGYTLTISEAVADANRVVIPVLITDATGHKRTYNSVFDPDSIKVLNEQGQEVGKIGVESSDTRGGERFDIINYFITGEIPNDRLIVEGKIARLGDGRRIPFVYGDWSFRFPLRISDSQERTVVSPINERTTTPQGLQITATQLVRTPSSVRLELVTKLKEEAKPRYPEQAVQHQSLVFHLEDAQGKVLYKTGKYYTTEHREPMYVLREFDQDSVHYSYYFDRLPYEQEAIRFVLDGFSMPEKSQDQITLDAASLKKQAAVFNSQGDRIHILSMDVRPNPNHSKSIAKMSLVIAVKASLTNMLLNDEYTVKDEQGNEYQSAFYGCVVDGSTCSPSNLIFEGIDKLPAKLTLMRTVVDKYNQTPGWSFLLPKN